ncbi:DUF5677 domain-containing protein [Vibrio splendidus]
MSFHENLIKESSAFLKGVKCKNSPRNHATVALMDLCYEHASSISLLLKHNKFGSALGLYRSCVEAYIRGVWLLNCASEHDVLEKINSQKKWLSLSVLVGQLSEKEEEFQFLNQYVKGQVKNILDSFTHGMSRQILSRFDGEKIKFRITESDINFLEKEACFFCLLAHATIAEVAESTDVEKKVLELFERMQKYV